MRVSVETICQALYLQARGGLKREVQAAARTGRTRRRPRRDPGQRTERFSDPMVMISDRPAGAEDRAVPGRSRGRSVARAFRAGLAQCAAAGRPGITHPMTPAQIH
jgi:IS30 family transposase